MPVYRTDPGVTLDDLIAILESRGEEIISATPNPQVTFAGDGERQWIVVTKPLVRVYTKLETR